MVKTTKRSIGVKVKVNFNLKVNDKCNKTYHTRANTP